MSSRAHRWNGDDHPLTGVHGGTAAAARRAIKEAKAARQLPIVAKANGKAVATFVRKDRMRPRSATGVIVYDPAPLPPPIPVPKKIAERVISAEVAPVRSFTLSRAQQVFDKCGGICVYCVKPMLSPGLPGDDPMGFSIDHDVPRSRGGSNRLANLVGAHKRCNNEKGSLTGAEYRAVLAARA